MYLAPVFIVFLRLCSSTVVLCMNVLNNIPMFLSHTVVYKRIDDGVALTGGELTDEQKAQRFELEAKALQFELCEY